MEPGSGRSGLVYNKKVGHRKRPLKKFKKKLIKILHTDQPVPAISENITTYITEKLKDENHDFVVEYGSGNSTRPNGNYIEGTNRTLKNRRLYGNKKKIPADKTNFFYGREDVPVQELIEKEVWHYNSVG